VVERYRRLGLNPYQGNKLSKKLKAKKLIQYEEIKTFRGRLKIIRLTRSAEKLLAVKSSFNSTGSFEHEFWKHKIACHLKNKGFKVIPEYSLPDGGKTDILAIKNSKTLAIEIETGKSEVAFNIIKNLNAGFDKVFSLGISEEVITRIKEQLSKTNPELIDKCSLISIKEFLKTI